MLTIGNETLYTQAELDTAITEAVTEALMQEEVTCTSCANYEDRFFGEVINFYIDNYFSGEDVDSDEELDSDELHSLYLNTKEYLSGIDTIDVLKMVVDGALLENMRNMAKDIIKCRAKVYEITFSRRTYFKIRVKANSIDEAEDAVYDLSDYEIDDYVDYTEDTEIEDYSEYDSEDFRPSEIDVYMVEN